MVAAISGIQAITKPYVLNAITPKQQKRMESARTLEAPPASLNSPKKEEKILSRHERRAQERLKSDVEEMYNTLTVKFLDYFTASDNPEGQDVQEKAKQIAAQWRLYCSRKNLIRTLYPIVDTYINGLMKEYIDDKDSIKFKTLLDTETKDK